MSYYWFLSFLTLILPVSLCFFVVKFLFLKYDADYLNHGVMAVYAFLLWILVIMAFYMPLSFFSLKLGFVISYSIMTLCFLYTLSKNRAILKGEKIGLIYIFTRKNNFWEVVSLFFWGIILLEGACATYNYPLSWDGWAIWGLKSKAIFMEYSISRVFFTDYKYFGFSHLNYPILYPLMQTWGYVSMSGVNEFFIKQLDYLFLIMMLVVGHRFLYGKLEFIYLNFVLTVFSGIFISFFARYSGSAETPLAFFYLFSSFLLYLWIKRKDNRLLFFNGIVVGLAANVKMEGVLFFVSSFTFIFIYYLLKGEGFKKTLAGLFLFFLPFLVFTVPWIAIQKKWGLVSFFEVNGRFKLDDFYEICLAILVEFFQNLRNFKFWSLSLIVISVSCFKMIYDLFRHRTMKLEARLMPLFFLYLFFVSAAYFYTPFDYVWHIKSSLNRIIFSVMPAMFFLSLSYIFSTRETL